MNRVGMGLIGSGYMGRTYAACLTRHVPNGRLVSVWGGKRAPALGRGVRGRRRMHRSKRCSPARRSKRSSSPRPTRRTVPQALAAAAAGKHVYIEKPMALSVAECDAIIAACDGGRRQADGQLRDPLPRRAHWR